MPTIDPKVKTLVRENRGTRLHILLILWAMPAPATVAEIAQELGSNRKTIGESLPAMEHDGYVAHIGAGRHPRWTLTDKARQLPLPGLFLVDSDGRISPVTSSSSSSDLSVYDIRSDQVSEEEEESSLTERTRIADTYRLTGDYRATVLADPWITEHRFEGWHQEATHQGKRSPAAYAVTCCSRHHEPPEEETPASAWATDIKRRDEALRLRRESNANS